MTNFFMMIAELIYGNGHVSELSLLIMLIIGLLVVLFPVAFIITGKMIRIAFVGMGVAIAFLPIYHEGRFSECKIEQAIAEIDSTKIPVDATYCRYKGETLDTEWGDWKVVMLSSNV